MKISITWKVQIWSFPKGSKALCDKEPVELDPQRAVKHYLGTRHSRWNKKDHTSYMGISLRQYTVQHRNIFDKQFGIDDDSPKTQDRETFSVQSPTTTQPPRHW